MKVFRHTLLSTSYNQLVIVTTRNALGTALALPWLSLYLPQHM